MKRAAKIEELSAILVDVFGWSCMLCAALLMFGFFLLLDRCVVVGLIGLVLSALLVFVFGVIEDRARWSQEEYEGDEEQ